MPDDTPAAKQLVNPGAQQGNILLGCIPGLSPEQVGMHENAERDAANKLLSETLSYLLRTVANWYKKNPADLKCMIALENHPETGGWHYHWAVWGLKKASMSPTRFTEFSNILKEYFGKWSYLAFGKKIDGLITYYRKNCDGMGDRNGLFLAIPAITQETIIAQATLREKKVASDYVAINAEIQKHYKDRTMQQALDAGIIPLKDLERWVDGCRLIDQITPMTKEEKARIFNTEIYWIHGKSRTGKTSAAINYFCFEEVGNPNSRPLSWVKLNAATITKGFMNGYEGEEMIIIDECLKGWGSYYQTLSALKCYLDNKEGFIDIKGGHVKKRAWRWVLTSNYNPHEVFSTEPKGQGNFQVPAALDMQGIFDPLYQRIIRIGDHMNVGNIMVVVNEPGDFTQGCVVRDYNWFTGEISGDFRSLGGYVPYGGHGTPTGVGMEP